MPLKKNVFVFVFDGYADWEIAYAMVGINKSNLFCIETIAFDKGIKKSMAGLSVIPDLDFLPAVDLNDIDSANAAMLILPGGDAWKQGDNEEINMLVKHCVEQGITVAAICDATIFLADHGMLDNIRHTSNSLEYLHEVSPAYSGHSFYESVPSVYDNNIVTASGAAAIDFASEIFKALSIDQNENTQQWFQYLDKEIVKPAGYINLNHATE